jgi:hypothetical protein
MRAVTDRPCNLFIALKGFFSSLLTFRQEHAQS